MPQLTKECCRFNLCVMPSIHYCLTCGNAVSDKHNDPQRTPSDILCHDCNVSGIYRLIFKGVGVHCPNCGRKTGKGLCDPKGFMACMGHIGIR